MRLILDECIDRRLTGDFVGHDIKTVPQMGWAGIKNGQLLTLVEASFDVFITVDRNLAFQQNLPRFDVAVIVLQARSNCLADLKLLELGILVALPLAQKGKATTITL
jgi:hypothetical protein